MADQKELANLMGKLGLANGNSTNTLNGNTHNPDPTLKTVINVKPKQENLGQLATTTIKPPQSPISPVQEPDWSSANYFPMGNYLGLTGFQQPLSPEALAQTPQTQPQLPFGTNFYPPTDEANYVQNLVQNPFMFLPGFFQTGFSAPTNLNPTLANPLYSMPQLPLSSPLLPFDTTQDKSQQAKALDANSKISNPLLAKNTTENVNGHLQPQNSLATAFPSFPQQTGFPLGQYDPTALAFFNQAYGNPFATKLGMNLPNPQLANALYAQQQQSLLQQPQPITPTNTSFVQTNIPSQTTPLQENVPVVKVSEPKISPPSQQPVKPQTPSTSSQAPTEVKAKKGPKSWADIANVQTGAIPIVAPSPPVVMPKPTPVSSKQTVVTPKQGGVLNVAPSTPTGNSNGAVKQSHPPRQPKEKPPRTNAVHGALVADFDINPPSARFFVIKSYSEDDVHKSIKFSVWASTDGGNKRLDAAYQESHEKGPIYLFFSVNGSGHFCGVAEMTSPVNFETKCEYWQQDKWNGSFTVRWIFIKDIPNTALRHIRLKNNEDKPVTNSRDTQEVLYEQGLEVLKILSSYKAKTSIIDDFDYYDQQEGKKEKEKPQTETTATAPAPKEKGVEKEKSPRHEKQHRAQYRARKNTTNNTVTETAPAETTAT